MHQLARAHPRGESAVAARVCMLILYSYIVQCHSIVSFGALCLLSKSLVIFELNARQMQKFTSSVSILCCFRFVGVKIFRKRITSAAAGVSRHLCIMVVEITSILIKYTQAITVNSGQILFKQAFRLAQKCVRMASQRASTSRLSTPVLQSNGIIIALIFFQNYCKFQVHR